MNILKLTLLLSVWYFDWTCSQVPPELPKSKPSPRAGSEPYQEQNKCAFLGVVGGALPYKFWTCGLAYKQAYCGQTMDVTYECCPGFVRNKKLLNNECGESESAWKLLGDHLTSYSNPKMAELLKSKAQLPQLFDVNGTETYTLFLPYSDDATKFADFDLTTATGDPHPIRMHIAKNRIYSGRMNNGATFETTFDKHKLKVTTYSNGLIFIDCRALTSPDHEARNGIIHYISGPILPHVGSGYSRKTVLQALQKESDTSAFYNSIPTNLRNLLDQESDQKWFTVMAPTNYAWNTISSKYGASIETVVMNHILTKMICAQAITRKATSLGPTMANEYLGVDCTGMNSRSFIDACGKPANIVKEDLVAGNGVVQIIDSVLVPSSVMDMSDAVNCANGGESKISLTEVTNIISRCSPSLDSEKNIVFLAPISEAFKEIGAVTNECEVLKYHILSVEQLSGQLPSLPNQAMHKTKASDATVVTYEVADRSGLRQYFNNARAVRPIPRLFKNGFIYFVDKVLFPPTKTIMQVISERSVLSDTHQKLKESGFDSELNSLGPNVLFLAPQNHGWKTRDEVKYDAPKMKSLFQLQTIKLNLWAGQDGYFHPETITSVPAVFQEGGKPFELLIKRELNGNTYIGYNGLPFNLWTMVISPNLHATNGMVWMVDWPLRFKN